jgi:Domain of unknown function (DUF4432)
MTRYKTWTLTDVPNDIWLDSFAVSNDSLRLATPHDWSIRKRTLKGGLRDGVDLIEVHNGALSCAVLPTRGMGLWRGEYRGNYLGWRAPIVGPVHPHFVHLDERGGLGWLAGFDEWLCRCGLSSNGPPGEDVFTDRNGRTQRSKLTLHGRIANLPAHFVELRINLDPPHELTLVGEVEEGCLFFPHLSLKTGYTTVPGSHRLVVHDVVENRAAEPTELQMLYHCNLGPPFLEAGSRVVAPIRELAPLTPRAAEGIETFDTYPGPTPGFSEQVYCYDLLADSAGRTLVLLFNAAADRGLVLRWNRQELPSFTLWRNTAAVEDGYVTGLEPGTNFPNFKSFERQQGRVPLLPPGGRWECTWSIEVFDSAASVAKVLAEVVELQARARPIIHRVPQPGYSALSG